MKLRVKINLAILLTFVIIALVYAAILFPFELQRRQTVIEQIELTLTAIIAQREEQLADEIFGRQNEAIKITINELLKVKGIAAIRIYLNDGALFQSSDGATKKGLDKNQFQQLTPQPRFIRENINGRPLLNFAGCIEVIGENIGFIEVDYDLSRVEKEARTSKMISMAMLVTVLLAMFGLLNLLLSKMVLKPVYILSKTIKKIQDGALGEQAQLNTRDEMGSMATAFNAMSMELADLNQGLEQRVTERTEQLFKANNKLEEARAIAETSTEQKSEFLANMSHEIRSPMNAIIGLSHLALKLELTPKLRDYLVKIESSSKALLGIINDILDFSKIEAGKLCMEKIPFRLDDVLDNLRSMVAIKAEERGIELIFHTGRGVSNHLMGDPLRLGQVLLNLSTNAIKFTDTGHVLIKIESLDTDEDSTKLRFSVIDTGIGLNERQCAKLFQSFSQADSSTTRKYGGTGLGLTICKNIVELLGGAIKVKSIPDMGSIFYFTTCFELDKNSEATALKDIYGDSVAGVKVLVVDDNAVAREIVSDHLDPLRLEISEVASGYEALTELENAALKNRPYQLVLMDWKMDGMDGIETSYAVKQSSIIIPPPKIIMITSYGREEIIEKANNAGLDGYLVKPVEQRLLLTKVAMVLTGEAKTSISDDRRQERQVDGLAAIQGARALVVEDNEINQQVAAELLADAGLEVEIAFNGQQALNRITAETDPKRFDIVFMDIQMPVMDIQMPVMDGHAATRKIRAAGAPLSNVPIVAMTAHAMESERHKCIENGMNDHLPKPIDPELLQKTLVEWIEPRERKVAETTPEPEPESTSGKAEEIIDLLPAELPGFDLTAGLSRVAGKKRLYLELLLKFARNNRRSSQQLFEMFEQRQYEEGQHLAHAIKGNAGNLGAMRLHGAATELEQAFVEANEIEPKIHPFEEELQTVLESISTLAPEDDMEEPGETVEKNALDLDQINKIIEQLKQQISSDYGEALESTNRLQALVKGSAIAPQIGKLVECLDNFDEQGAENKLQEIDQQLNSAV